MNKRRFLIYAILAIAIAFVATSTTNAAADDFYKGKTISFIVGNAPGGGYDTYTRLTARHISKYIPGDPTTIVQNRPGGGSLISANYLYKRVKPNGLTVGIWNSGLIVQQLLGARSVQFDASKFGWVGAPVVGLPACAVMGSTGVKTFDEIRRSNKPLKFGATGPGTTTTDMPKIINKTLGMNWDVITGYSGTSTIRVAMQRHEVDGFCAGWESMRVTARPMLMAKGDQKLIPIFIHGKSNDPEVRNLPQITSLIKGKDNQAMFKAWVLSYQFQRPLSLPPGVPKDRLQILRKAYKASFSDPKLQSEAKKSKLILDYVSGEEIENYVKEILETPPKAKEGLEFLLSGPRR